MKGLLPSDYISPFNKFIKSFKQEYDYWKSEVELQEKIECDYIHQIELGEYKDRRKAANELHKCLVKRREAKDILYVLDPIKEWLDNNIKSMNALSQVLGTVRNREAKLPRHYTPRAVKDLPIAKKDE